MNSSKKLVCIYGLNVAVYVVSCLRMAESHIPAIAKRQRAIAVSSNNPNIKIEFLWFKGPDLSTLKMNKHISSPRTWLMHILNSFILPDLLLSLLEGSIFACSCRWPDWHPTRSSASQYSNQKMLDVFLFQPGQ